MDSSQTPNASTVPASPESLPTKVDGPSEASLAGEVSLIDVLKFLRRRFKVICGVTLATILVGLGSRMIATPQIQRELLLELTLSPELLLNANIAAQSPMVWGSVTAPGNSALSQDLSERMNSSTQSAPVSISLDTVAAANPQHLQLVLMSENAVVLEAASQAILEMLEEAADEVAESILEPEIARLDLLIQRSQAKINQLENRLASSDPLPSEDSVTFSGFLKLQRQDQQQSLLTQELYRLADYELEHADLSALKANDASLVSIDVLVDNQIQGDQSLVRRLVLSAIAGFMLSILIALIIDQIPQIRSALATPES